ncbi:MAG: efflux RND transporter periplasmic adaptor subunit [Deltaproteobacteria bacterium]|nr:efflux RND transporter periplasmic adaptor subunit [Deltaproteobacteria bacterium]
MAAAAAAAFVLSCGPEGPAPGGAPGAQDRAPRAVRVVEAEESRLPRSLTATGTLAAAEEVVAAFKVAGRVAEIGVDLGSTVRKGQFLARLDDADFAHRVEQAEAALRQARVRLGLPEGRGNDHVDPEKTALVQEARAVLEEARLNRDRLARLVEKDFVTRADLDAAVARLLVAEARHVSAVEEIRVRQALLVERRAELSLARQQLADTVLVAPLAAAVRARRASVGEFLAAGAPVVDLVQIHPLRLRISIPEKDAAALRVGQPVRVRVEGEAAQQTGHVVRLSPAFQEDSRTLALEAEVPNPQGRLRPGSFARAEIVVEAERPVVLVPASAVVNFAGIEKVLAVREGRAVERPVRSGRRVNGRVEIVEGLAAGEPIVAEPGNLVGGQPVTLLTPSAPAR